MRKYNKNHIVEPVKYCKAVINNKINPDDVPTLIPEKSLTLLQENDSNPFYAVETVENINEEANGVLFLNEFWGSLFAKLKKRPIPGSRDGHLSVLEETRKRAQNDHFVVGGRVRENKVDLKIYIPPEGENGSNKTFIKNIKLGLVHFSIVSWTKDEIERDENGFIKSVIAVKSVKGERNDAVEVDMGAMKQKVNKKKQPAEKLPEKIDIKSEKQNSGGKYIMSENDYKDIVENLNNRVIGGAVNKKQLAKDLEIEMVTTDHKNAMKTMKEINDLLGENPVDAIKQMKADEAQVKQAAFDNLREKLMSEKFRPETIKVNGKEESNLVRAAAEPLVSKVICSEEELKTQIETANDNPVVKKLSHEQADITADVNDLSGVVKTAKNTDDEFSSETVEM